MNHNKFDLAYLKMAKEWAKLSYCERKKVGALIVKDRMIISDGYNGTPSGAENCCEDEGGKTHWYVLHAEANAILKLASSTQSAKGATLYLTLSPCKECSKNSASAIWHQKARLYRPILRYRRIRIFRKCSSRGSSNLRGKS